MRKIYSGLLLLSVLALPSALHAKINLKFSELNGNGDIITETDLENSEDNRQIMKTALKDLRLFLLEKYKKNRKTRRAEGKNSLYKHYP